MARLAHPNVVAVHEVVEAGDDFFIAMERVDGPDLATWLAETPRARAEALRVVVGAGRGIAAAHAAGLVHRDVKPANILIGRDGRARITDLGLAATIAELDRDAPLAPAAFPNGSASRLVGTPGYLAPEVAAGARGDARSDQYAFAITAWQALFGNRPGPDRRERGRVARVLRRALAEPPAERFPSITALVDQLERAGHPRWPRYIVGALTLAAVALGIAWWRERDHGSADTACERDPAVGGVWSSSRRTELAASLAMLDTSPTHALAPHAIELIDERARGWSAAVVDVCTALHRGTQSAELANRRGACLEDQRHQLAAVIDPIGERTNAVQALVEVAQLPTAAACDDPAGHGRWNLPLHQLARTELVAIEALREAGRYDEAMTRLSSLAPIAPKNDPSFAATIAYTRADIAMRAGNDNDALTFAHEAVALAERGRDDKVRVNAMVVLVAILVDLGRSTELAAVVPLLEAAAGRITLDDALAAHLENTLGNAADSAGHYAEAERHYRAALAANEREYGGTAAPMIAGVLGNLGSVLQEQGKLDDARAFLDRAVAMFEATLGPDHPEIATLLIDLGTISLADDLDRAAALFERASRIRVAALGPDHPRMFEPTMMLGRVETQRGHRDQALELFRRALALAEHGFGAGHPAVASVQFQIASLLADRDARAALELAEDSVKIWEATGAVQVDAYAARYLLAQLLWHDGAHARARALAETARAGYAALGPNYDNAATGVATWLAAHNSR